METKNHFLIPLLIGPTLIRMRDLLDMKKSLSHVLTFSKQLQVLQGTLKNGQECFLPFNKKMTCGGTHLCESVASRAFPLSQSAPPKKSYVPIHTRHFVSQCQSPYWLVNNNK